MDLQGLYRHYNEWLYMAILFDLSSAQFHCNINEYNLAISTDWIQFMVGYHVLQVLYTQMLYTRNNFDLWIDFL